MENKKLDPIEILFPEEEVTSGNITVKVTPLPLSNMPKVINAFTRLLQYIEQNKSQSDIAFTGISELLEIIPYCVDVPPEKIPSYMIPDIIEVILKQNLSESTMGKWKALIQKAVQEIAGKK